MQIKKGPKNTYALLNSYTTNLPLVQIRIFVKNVTYSPLNINILGIKPYFRFSPKKHTNDNIELNITLLYAFLRKMSQL